VGIQIERDIMIQINDEEISILGKLFGYSLGKFWLRVTWILIFKISRV
jgi:hypothetical protein